MVEILAAALATDNLATDNEAREDRDWPVLGIAVQRAGR
jgi:hypothetical protein